MTISTTIAKHLVGLVLLLCCLTRATGTGTSINHTFFIELTRTTGDVEAQAIHDAINETSNSYPKIEIIQANTTIMQDTLEQAEYAIERRVLAVVHGSNTTENDCLISDVTKIPMILLNNNRRTIAGACEHAITMSADSTSYAQATVAILDAFTWTKIALLFEPTRFPEAVHLQSISQTRGYSLKFIEVSSQVNETLHSTAERMMYEIALHDAEVILLYVGKEFMDVIVTKRACNPLKSYVWIIQNSVSSTLKAHGKHMILAFRFSTTDGSQSEDALVARDAILVLRNATKEMIQNGVAIGNTTAAFYTTTQIFGNYLKQVAGYGSTGLIRFDDEGNRVVNHFEIMNLRNDTFVVIGVWDKMSSTRIDQDVQPNVIVKTSSNASLQGTKLNIVTIVSEPFVIKTIKDGKPHYDGFLMDILKELTEQLKFTYTLHESYDGMYGAKINGTWNGMIGELLQKKADLVLADLTRTRQREKVVDFSVAYIYYTDDIIMAKTQKEERNFVQFMLPYSLDVWALSFLSIVIFGVLVFLMSGFSPFGVETGEFTLLNSLWFSLACMLQQGGDNTPKALSSRIATGVYWFFILIIVSTYTANLAAFLTIKEIIYPITDLQSAIDSEYELGVTMSTNLYSFFKSSDYDLYKRAWKKMNADQSFPKSHKEALAWARSRKYAHIVDGTVAAAEAAKQPCDLRVVKALSTPNSLGLAMKQGDPHLNQITLALLRMLDSGYLDILNFKWWKDKDECPGIDTKTIARRKMELENMLGVYMVLGAGIVVSFCLLVLEIVWYKYGNARFDAFWEKYCRKNRVQDVKEDSDKEMETEKDTNI